MSTVQRFDWAIIAGLSVIALVLRLASMDESLFADELLTYDIAARPSAADVLHALNHAPESTPPLHYLLAWAATKLGNPTVMVRLPSLLAGVALVPVVFLLGRRLVGPFAAKLAAVVIALAPFALFYSTEARAYALLSLLVAGSSLLLLRALEDGRRSSWGVFAIVATLALYTHYTAVFPLAAQCAWALWCSPRRRAILISHAAVGLAYLPWLPFMRGSSLGVIGLLDPLSVRSAFRDFAVVLVGHPFRTLGEVPGRVGLITGVLAVAVGVVALALRFRDRRQLGVERGAGAASGAASGEASALRPGSSRAVVLVVALAVVTPLGLLCYFAVTGTDLYTPRYLSASAPALFLAVALLLTRRRGAFAVVAATLALLAVGRGTVQSLQPDSRRPGLKEAAHYIEARARPGDVIMHVRLPIVARGPLQRDLEVNLRRRLPDFPAVAFVFRGTVYGGEGNAQAWAAASSGGRVFVVGPTFGAAVLPKPPARFRLRLLEGKRFKGLVPITLKVYGR